MAMYYGWIYSHLWIQNQTNRISLISLLLNLSYISFLFSFERDMGACRINFLSFSKPNSYLSDASKLPFIIFIRLSAILSFSIRRSVFSISLWSVLCMLPETHVNMFVLHFFRFVKDLPLANTLWKELNFEIRLCSQHFCDVKYDFGVLDKC